MEYSIIPMQEEHIPAAARLEAICFSEPWTENVLRSGIKSDTGIFFAAEKNGKLLGYAGMHMILGECYVDNIAVFPEARGQGIGRALTRALIDHGRKHKGIFISLEVRPSNLPAVTLYRSLGFQEAGRRKNYYTRPTEDGLIMTLNFC